MKTSEARTWLLKYYEGLTTPEEEATLASWFRDNPDEPGFEMDRLHFEALAEIRKDEVPIPENLESKVLARLEPIQQPVRRIGRRYLYMVASIAAALLILVSTVLFLGRNQPVNAVTDTKLAYAESRRALATVSHYLNKGTSQLAGLDKLNTAILPLGHLKKLDKTTASLLKLGKSTENR